MYQTFLSDLNVQFANKWCGANNNYNIY